VVATRAGGAYEQALEAVAALVNGVRRSTRRGQAVDLFEMAGDSMMKRLVPVGSGWSCCTWRLVRRSH
jgi:hypothetical protein